MPCDVWPQLQAFEEGKGRELKLNGDEVRKQLEANEGSLPPSLLGTVGIIDRLQGLQIENVALKKVWRQCGGGMAQ